MSTAWGRLASTNEEHLPSVHLIKAEHSVGRSPECDTVLTNWCISWRHCVLQWLEDSSTCRLTDHSTNGTWVNKRKVGKDNTVTLRDGDQVMIVMAGVKSQVQPLSYVLHVVSAPSPTTGLVPTSPADRIEDRYDVLAKVLGRGTFSEVRLGRCRQSGEWVAVKVMPKRQLSFTTVAKPDNMRREVEILKKIGHPHIITVKDVFDTEETLYLVLELAQGGELFHRIKARKFFREADAYTIFAQLCQAVEYLHSHGIAHRDLKPENILLTAPDDITNVKLSDFGFAVIYQETYLMTTMCGTPTYVAPEVVMSPAEGGTGYTKAVDLWSLGVILYVLLCGWPPFSRHATGQRGVNYGAPVNLTTPPWPSVSDEAKDLVQRLLTVTPADRISINGTLEHPWLAMHAKLLEGRDDESTASSADGGAPTLGDVGRQRARVNSSAMLDGPSLSPKRRRVA